MIPHYANAKRIERGVCWRMVSRPPGYRVDTPTDCLEPVRWVGRSMVGKRRINLWSCEGHSEGLEELNPVPHKNLTNRAGEDVTAVKSLSNG